MEKEEYKYKLEYLGDIEWITVQCSNDLNELVKMLYILQQLDYSVACINEKVFIDLDNMGIMTNANQIEEYKGCCR